MKKRTVNRLQKKSAQISRQLAEERAYRNDLYRIKKLPGQKRQATHDLKKSNEKIESLRERLRKSARAEAYARTLSKFRPTKRQRGKFVFIGQSGKATRGTSKGLFVRVSKTGRVRPVLAGRRDRRLYRKGSISLVSRVAGKAAKSRARKASVPFRLGTIKGRPARGTLRQLRNPYRELGKRVTITVRQMLRNKRTLRQVLVEVRLVIRRGNRLETHIITVGLDAPQAAATKAGDLDLSRTIWKQVSDYLANLELVTTGSARHIKDDSKEDFEEVEVEAMEYVVYEGGP